MILDYFMKIFARKHTRAVCYLGFGYSAITSGCHREGSTSIYLSSSALGGRHAERGQNSDGLSNQSRDRKLLILIHSKGFD